DEQLEILQKLGVEKSKLVLDRMDNDDLASLLADIEPHRADELLANMNVDESTIVQNLMNYPPETAGRIMNNRYVWIPGHYTIREAIDKIKVFIDLAEYLNYLYVVDDQKRLEGVVSYKDLLLGELDEEIRNV